MSQSDPRSPQNASSESAGRVSREPELEREDEPELEPPALDQMPREAVGEDEHQRPQPAFEPVDADGPETDLSGDPDGGGGSPNEDLYGQMAQTIDKLRNDNATRGDLKILSRTLRELRYAFKVFRPFRRIRKLTVFGSARTPPQDPAYQATVELSRKIAGHGWMVITGAGGGIMAAGHEGAGREASMGLNIMLPFEQSANEFIDGDPKLVTMKYFFTRKLMFVKECSGVVCMPGGFGTLDEALETLTLMQTGKQVLMPLVLLDPPGGSYWKDLGRFIDRHLGGGGMISPEDTRMYKITDNVDEAIEETLNFYNVYHSMRYVRDRLVFRLKRKLSDEHLERLQDRFADILVSGSFQQTTALPQERESELADLPRLVFHFDRRHLGRLRILIDDINSV